MLSKLIASRFKTVSGRNICKRHRTWDCKAIIMWATMLCWTWGTVTKWDNQCILGAGGAGLGIWEEWDTPKWWELGVDLEGRRGGGRNGGRLLSKGAGCRRRKVRREGGRERGKEGGSKRERGKEANTEQAKEGGGIISDRCKFRHAAINVNLQPYMQPCLNRGTLHNNRNPSNTRP